MYERRCASACCSHGEGDKVVLFYADAETDAQKRIPCALQQNNFQIHARDSLSVPLFPATICTASSLLHLGLLLSPSLSLSIAMPITIVPVSMPVRVVLVRMHPSLYSLIDEEASTDAGCDLEQVGPETPVEAQEAVGAEDVADGVDCAWSAGERRRREVGGERGKKEVSKERGAHPRHR